MFVVHEFTRAEWRAEQAIPRLFFSFTGNCAAGAHGHGETAKHHDDTREIQKVVAPGAWRGEGPERRRLVRKYHDREPAHAEKHYSQSEPHRNAMSDKCLFPGQGRLINTGAEVEPSQKNESPLN